MSTWLAGLSGAVEALWLPLTVLSGVAMGAILAGGLADRRRAVGASARAAPAPREAASSLRPLAAGPLDLDTELRAAAEGLVASARQRHVRLQVAVQPDLTVRSDAVALRQIVTDLLANAIAHTEGGAVLLSAGRHGGRIQIAVIDDGVAVDASEQAAHLRDAERLAALQGGTLEITVRPATGTT
ncbi:MAG: ATP-binding protein, partial [Acetobacteraceae bacterium]